MALTRLELECLDVFTELADLLPIWSALRKSERVDLMASIRDAKKHLDNKRFGCASGLHAGPCNCKEGVPGNSRGRC